MLNNDLFLFLKGFSPIAKGADPDEMPSIVEILYWSSLFAKVLASRL